MWDAGIIGITLIHRFFFFFKEQLIKIKFWFIVVNFVLHTDQTGKKINKQQLDRPKMWGWRGGEAIIFGLFNHEYCTYWDTNRQPNGIPAHASKDFSH